MMQDKNRQKAGDPKAAAPDTETGAGQVGDEVVDPLGRTMKGVSMGDGDGEGTGVGAGTGGEKPEIGGVRPDKQTPKKS